MRKGKRKNERRDQKESCIEGGTGLVQWRAASHDGKRVEAELENRCRGIAVRIIEYYNNIEYCKNEQD